MAGRRTRLFRKVAYDVQGRVATYEAIVKGVTPVPREKVKVDHAEIYEYLPKTNCQICGEQSCYAFAIMLVGRETSIDKCTPLLEAKYETNLEHIRTLLEYL